MKIITLMVEDNIKTIALTGIGVTSKKVIVISQSTMNLQNIPKGTSVTCNYYLKETNVPEPTIVLEECEYSY